MPCANCILQPNLVDIFILYLYHMWYFALLAEILQSCNGFRPLAHSSMYKTTVPTIKSNCRDYMSVVIKCSEQGTFSARQQPSSLHTSRAWGLACCVASRSCARAVEMSASSCLCWFSRPNASSATQTMLCCQLCTGLATAGALQPACLFMQITLHEQAASAHTYNRHKLSSITCILLK